MRNWSILQEPSQAQLKQGLKIVRNVCQPKTGATTGNERSAYSLCLAGRGNFRLGQCYSVYNKLWHYEYFSTTYTHNKILKLKNGG
jgi:hypothetical protein